MDVHKKEVVQFVATIPPGTDRMKLTERIKGDGTVEMVKVRFFRGQQRALHVRPYIMHRRGKPEDLITYPDGTDPYLSGDDDYLVIDTVIPVANDDEIIIEVTNTDVDDAYTLNVSITLDYYGGQARVV